MFPSFYRFLAHDIAFSLACAAVSVAVAVVGLWSVGMFLGDDPMLMQAMLPRATAVSYQAP